MSEGRNAYGPGLGVLPLEWHNAGEYGDVPRTEGVVLVEIWTPRLHFWRDVRPTVQVSATYQLWAYRDVTGWHRIRPNGDLEPIAQVPKVRRWATFNASRQWSTNITLDGWGR